MPQSGIMNRIITSCIILMLLASCQKEAIQELEAPAQQAITIAEKKIVYMDYNLQEISVNNKSRLVVITTFSLPTPKEIKIDYVVLINNAFNHVNVTVPAGVTSHSFETAPYTPTSVPFEIIDVIVNTEVEGWTLRFAKP